MPRYTHGTSYHHQSRYIRKVRRLVIGIVVIVLLVSIAMLADSLREKKQSETPSEATVGIHGNYSPTSQIFRTPYFQFQASQNWKEVPAESTATRFVYRSFRGTLVRRELIIMVNDPAAAIHTTRVLPVDVGPDNELVPDEVSDHCRDAVPAGSKDKTTVTVNEVRFMCDPDAADYTVSIGLKGGAAPMELTRPDGSRAIYHIVYRDVTAELNTQKLYEVISTFQIR